MKKLLYNIGKWLTMKYYPLKTKTLLYPDLRLYIEFKRPGTILTLRDGITIKSEYLMQYKRHICFWEQNSVAYSCSELDGAKELFRAYKGGKPLPMQVFSLPGSNSPDTFFDDYRTHLDGIG